MRRLGVHTSIAGGLSRSIDRARALGCTTIQIFSHNPRSWSLKSIPDEEIRLFRDLRERYDISPVYIHASYLINLASRDDALREKSIDMLREEMDRADMIGADFVVLHTGSAAGEDARSSRQRSIGALNELTDRGVWNAGLLIENTAGERGDFSSRIEEIGEIVDGVNGSLVSGICLDTCHAFSAGYDVRSRDGIAVIAAEIETFISLKAVKLIHLNDSKGARGAGIDRHEHIGRGKIGREGLQTLLMSEHFKTIPIILETPKVRECDDLRNLRRVREMIEKERQFTNT